MDWTIERSIIQWILVGTAFLIWGQYLIILQQKRIFSMITEQLWGTPQQLYITIINHSDTYLQWNLIKQWLGNILRSKAWMTLCILGYDLISFASCNDCLVFPMPLLWWLPANNIKQFFGTNYIYRRCHHLFEVFHMPWWRQCKSTLINYQSMVCQDLHTPPPPGTVGNGFWNL